jgi:type IV secretory pathway VirB3-like protein
MREKEEFINKDLLFVALTRIPTVFGIPYMAFVIEVMFGSLDFITTDTTLIISFTLNAVSLSSCIFL